jgi:hypothetical protein
MRLMTLAALTMTSLAMAACGGDEPQPVAPAAPPPMPPPAETASAASTDTSPPAPPPKPALADLIPPALKSMGDAFNAHDAQKMGSILTDDAAIYAYGGGETHSKTDMQNGMTMFFGAFGDAKSTATRVWIKGNVAITELVWSGSMTGDMMGIKASKKPVGEMRVHVLFFTDDGLVREMHEYGDDAGLFMQMTGKKGAPPVPALPTNPPEVHAGKGTPDEDKLVDWAKAGDTTFSKDDPKAAMATMADDADYWLNVGGGPAAKGKKDLSKALGAWFKSFPDQQWTTVNAWGIDGFAIVEHTMSGTNKGAIGPIPATGKPVQSWHWLDIMQPTADGKVQHGWGYANFTEAFPPPMPKGTDAKPAAPKTK